jgi:hypothetical protein
VYNFTSDYYRNAVELPITRARQIGAQVIVVVSNCPTWACVRLCDLPQPAYFDALQAFLQVLLTKIQPEWAGWWNEPDTNSVGIPADWPYWGCSAIPETDCEDAGGELYVPSLKAFFESIQQIERNNNITIKVIAGNLSMGGAGYNTNQQMSCQYPDISTPDPNSPYPACGKQAISNYLHGILSAGGGQYFDAVGIHHYDWFKDEYTRVPMSCQQSAYDYARRELDSFGLYDKENRLHIRDYCYTFRASNYGNSAWIRPETSRIFIRLESRDCFGKNKIQGIYMVSVTKWWLALLVTVECTGMACTTCLQCI